VRVHLLGVRGSTAAPGQDFVRYGGNTSCVALARDGEPPTLVLDGGTGIRNLSELLDGEPFRGSLLLGHLHWDHTQGLPFARALDHDASRVDVYLPEQGDGRRAIDVVRDAMSPPHFPIEPEGLRGNWHYNSLAEGVHRLDGWEILAREIPHKGGRTYGFRITDGAATIAYLSDHGPAALGRGPDGWGPYHDAALQLASGVNLLIHDAQHTADELPAVAQFGHSAMDYAVELGRRAGADGVLFFHHDPSRVDDELDACHKQFECAPVPVAIAREGDVLDLPTTVVA
jgi:ribonuclease BN (tRNA processing enzyme)